jgi:antitoxin MazE
MQAVVKKWGNSLAVRLPQGLAADLNIAEGATVTMTVEDQRLVIAPARKRLRLDDLLAGVKKSQKRGETDWGKPIGDEVW